MTMHRYWEGYVLGTNRGQVFAIITEGKERARAKVLFYDQVYGPTTVTFEGTLRARRARLQLIRQQGRSPVLPLAGSATLELNDATGEVSGTWATDIGTQGQFRLRPSTRWGVRWCLRRVANAAKYAWIRLAPAGYCAGVLGLAIASAFKRCDISWTALILLLLPLPVLFQNRIAGIIGGLRIHKAGPIEFHEQMAPTPDLSQVLAYLDERLRFAAFDSQFVPRTKILLNWLGSAGPVSKQDFESVAKSIGVEGESLAATVAVLVSFGCVTIQDDQFSVTPLGERYRRYVWAYATSGGGA